MEIRKGTRQDIDELAALYEEMTDYLDCHVNYPGWKTGIYPIREDAVQGVMEGTLFVALEDGRVVGTVILRHQPEDAYDSADWHNDLGYEDILVVYTFAVRPQFLRQGIGRKIMEFVLDYAVDMGIKAVRLDVYEKNIPAIRLYERLGFQYIDTVDLGYGLNGYKLYQYLV